MQWLEFQATLTLLIMRGNSLTMGPAQMNLTRLLLKGEARHVFQAKAAKLREAMAANHERAVPCRQCSHQRHFLPKATFSLQDSRNFDPRAFCSHYQNQ